MFHRWSEINDVIGAAKQAQNGGRLTTVYLAEP